MRHAVAPFGATKRRVITHNGQLPAPNAQPHPTFHLAFAWSHCESPMTTATTSLSRARLSRLITTICCQVPSASSPSTIGTQMLVLSSAERTCEKPLPSPQRAVVVVVVRRRDVIERATQIVQ